MKVEKKGDKFRINHNKRLFYVILVLIVVFFALIFNICLRERKEGMEEIECKSREDCVKQQISCCPCNSGGKEACVSEKETGIIKKQLEKCPQPAELICAQVYSCEIKSCECVNGKCVGEE